MTVSINWKGLVRFLGWKGTIDELKQLKLPDCYPTIESRHYDHSEARSDRDDTTPEDPNESA